MTTSISTLAMQARADAALVIDRHTNPNQKKASIALYSVLVSCKELCERCEADEEERKELEKLFAAQPKEGNRRYVEKGSDIYQFICRFVFTDSDRTNAARYAAALRKAGEMQIRSTELMDRLKSKGGVNALYFSRALEVREIKTSALRLRQQITVSRDEPFTLTLQWMDDNSYKVVEKR